MNIAFIFPGQGSQIIGMGKEFYDAFSAAKETFQQVDDILNYKLSNIIFNGPEEDLTLTTNTQPALMAVSMAILNTIKDQTKKNINELCSVVAGHSLGEYSALCAAGALNLEDTTRLLQIRGKSMQEACPEGEGSMAACIGIGFEELQNLINQNINSGVCETANDNIEGQIVISGHTQNIDKMVDTLKNNGNKAIKLKVSAPFHCSLMKPAEKNMQSALEKVTINKPLVPIIANVTALPVTDQVAIKRNLILQICSTVRWRETLNQFAILNISSIIEIGSGKILSGMLRKTNHQFMLSNISTPAELDDFMNPVTKNP